MSALPDIAELEDCLFKLDAVMDAAEAHGALCGMLCAQGTADLSIWADHVLGERAESGGQLHEVVHQLSALHGITLEQLNDSDADFNLLIPDDDDDLDSRVVALADWCQGFVYGLAAGGIEQSTKLPEDTSEMLKDFIEISRAGLDGEEKSNDEGDEVAFMEILEYVRMGTLLINEELQPLSSSPTLQ